MLYAVLEGLAEDADLKGLTVLIRNTTGVLPRAAKVQVRKLSEGDALIFKVPAASLRWFLHEALRLGVVSADMMVGRVDE